jgi:hypothetical protein
MGIRRFLLLAVPLASSVALAALVGACGGNGGQNFSDAGNGGDAGDGGNVIDDSGLIFSDSSLNDTGPVDAAPPPPVDYVYCHSPSQLYKVDPVAKTIALVGGFTGFDGSDFGAQVIDMAIDANSNGFATTFGAAYKLDIKTAKLTLVKLGSYPNSLSFVPKGTLDPNVEALVGYNGSQYVRIDPTTGNVTNVGSGLSGGYASSGDIVSVTNGGTFLTVTGPNCGDCLLQIDPKTGAMIQNYGSINHSAVYGLAFWAGSAYGFDNAGELFSISWVNNALVTTNIPTTPGLQFWGAGSTTSAPATSADGGGLPIN